MGLLPPIRNALYVRADGPPVKGNRATAALPGLSSCNHLSAWGGALLSYLKGQLNEFDTLLNFAVPFASTLNFPIPRSHQSTVGGLFAEQILPVDDRLVIKSGARGDWVGMNTDRVDLPGFCPGDFDARASQVLGRSRDFERTFGWFLGYLTAEYKLNPQWTAVAGLGHAQRPPTTTELYALQPFLAVLQQGFTTVVGNPRLDPERLYQIDIGLRAEYERVRTGANGLAKHYECRIKGPVVKGAVADGLPLPRSGWTT